MESLGLMKMPVEAKRSAVGGRAHRPIPSFIRVAQRVARERSSRDKLKVFARKRGSKPSTSTPAQSSSGSLSYPPTESGQGGGKNF